MVNIEKLKQSPKFKSLTRRRRQAIVKEAYKRNNEAEIPVDFPLERNIQTQAPSFQVQHDQPISAPLPGEIEPVRIDESGRRVETPQQDLLDPYADIRGHEERAYEDRLNTADRISELSRDINAVSLWKNIKDGERALQDPELFRMRDVDVDPQTGQTIPRNTPIPTPEDIVRMKEEFRNTYDPEGKITEDTVEIRDPYEASDPQSFGEFVGNGFMQAMSFGNANVLEERSRLENELLQNNPKFKVGNTIGGIAGGVTQLMMLGGALQATGLPVAVQGVARKIFRTQLGVGARIAGMVNSGNLFGARGLLQEISNTAQTGEIDVGDIVKNVGLDWLQGGAFGATRFDPAISRVATIGATSYLTEALRDGDLEKAGVNAITYSLFALLTAKGMSRNARVSSLAEAESTLAKIFKAEKKMGNAKALKSAKSLIESTINKQGGKVIYKNGRLHDVKGLTPDDMFKLASEFNIRYDALKPKVKVVKLDAPSKSIAVRPTTTGVRSTPEPTQVAGISTPKGGRALVKGTDGMNGRQIPTQLAEVSTLNGDRVPQKTLDTQPFSGGQVDAKLDPKQIDVEKLKTDKIKIFRMEDKVKVKNTQGNEIVMPKGEEYRVVPLKDGKVRLQDGKQITVYEGELDKLKGQIILGEKDQPFAGGIKHDGKITGELKDKKLTEEAKKFKSVDEFIKSQGKTVFRGDYKRQQKIDDAMSTSLNKAVAESFSESGKVTELIVGKDAKIVDISTLRKDILGVDKLPDPSSLSKEQLDSIIGNNLIKHAREKGYDVIDKSKAGIKSSGVKIGKVLDEAEYQIVNPAIVKSKQELIDIYNKSQPKPLPKDITKQESKAMIDKAILKKEIKEVKAEAKQTLQERLKLQRDTLRRKKLAKDSEVKEQVEIARQNIRELKGIDTAHKNALLRRADRVRTENAQIKLRDLAEDILELDTKRRNIKQLAKVIKRLDTIHQGKIFTDEMKSMLNVEEAVLGIYGSKIPRRLKGLIKQEVSKDDFLDTLDVGRLVSKAKESLADLDSWEIKRLADGLANIDHLKKLDKKINDQGKVQDYYKEDLDPAIKELNQTPVRKTLKGKEGIISSGEEIKKVGVVKRLMTTAQYGAELVTELLGKSVNSSIKKSIFTRLDDGRRKELEVRQKSHEFFKDVRGKDKESWSEFLSARGKKSKPVTVNLDGKKFEMTRAEKISLYLLTRDADALRHLQKGGFSFPKTETRKHQLSDKGLFDLEESMTPEEMAFADKVSEFYNRSFFKDEINKTTTMLEGYEKATGETYFPISSNKLDRVNNDIKASGKVLDALIENIGSMQERVKNADGAIFVKDVFEVVDNSIKQLSAYIGYANPLRNVKQLLNDKQFRIPVIERFGKNYLDNLDSFVKAVEGEVINPDIADRLLKKLISRFQVSVLGFNPSVMMKQLISLNPASVEMEVSPQRLFVAKPTSPEEMSKYSPIIWDRARGNVNPEIGEAVRAGNVRGFWTDKKGITEKAMAGISKFDIIAIGKIWTVAKNKIKKASPKMSDEMVNELTARETERVTRLTQPNFWVGHRPPLLRSRSTAVKGFTMFGTQRNQQYQMGVREFERYKNSNKTAKDKGRLLKTAWILGVVNTAMLALINLGREKLLGRRSEKKTPQEFLTDMLVIKLGDNVAIGSLVNSLRSKLEKGSYMGYEVTNPAVDTVNGLINLVADVNAMSKRIKEGKPIDKQAKRILSKVALFTGKVTGVPVSGPKQVAEAIIPSTRKKLNRAKMKLSRGNKDGALDILIPLVEDGKISERYINYAVDKYFKE